MTDYSISYSGPLQNLMTNTGFGVWSYSDTGVDPPGISGANATAMDGWRRTALATCDISREDTTVYPGEQYSLKIVNTRETAVEVVWPSDVHYQNWFCAKFAGKRIAFGCWVYATVASEACIECYDGIDATLSDFHSGDSTWEWLELTHQFPVGTEIVHIGLRTQGTAASTTCYFSQPMLIFGEYIGKGNYYQNMNSIIWCEKAISFADYNGNDTIAANTNMNVEAQSLYKIPDGVRALYCRLSGQCATAGKYLGLGVQYPVLIHTQAADVLDASHGWVACEHDGDFTVYRDATWTNVHIAVTGVKVGRTDK